MDESPSQNQIQNRAMLAGKLVSELQAIAEQVGVKEPKKRKKAELIDAILGTAPQAPGGAPSAAPTGPPSGALSGAAESNGGPAGAGPGTTQESPPNGAAGNRGHWRAARGEAAQAQLPQTEPHEPQPAHEPGAAPEHSERATGAEGAPERAAAGVPAGPEALGGPATVSQAPAPPSGDYVALVPAQPGQGGPATNGDMPAPAPTGVEPSHETDSSQATTQAGTEASTQAPPDTRPEYRREGEGVRERDRGRRRRRRERGGDRPERPGDRQPERQERIVDRPDRQGERPDRLGERQERMDRPRREADFDDPGDLEVRTGVLDVLPEGYGFLRTSGYLPGQEDVYVSLSQVRRAQLRRGDHITGAVRRPKEGEKYQALVRIDKVDDLPPEEIVGRKWFEKLTPLYPEERLHMELDENPGQITQRIIDLVAPIGKGQRGMIVSPPKAGKTTIMKQIANSITTNNPECHLIVLLVDERPEEVTDMQRSVEGEIVYSTFDRPSEDHIQVTELTLDRAKRLVELGNDVVILLDGITRLSRAYNLATPASGRILSGGVDSTALYPPKRFFGAARNIEQGGSLTIIATALVETGSRMDEVIFEEFKGTGNWELKLDRRASEKRIFPAIDIQASGTRKEELLLGKEELALVWKLRRVLHALDGTAALELLVDKMRQTKGNMQFLKEIQKVQIGD
ncbi:MAG TPA: transcription termination factor Rho [Actinomycetota bacterium]|nr:transcription termination factor Rho [Actinomycetota bacterium]